MDLMKEYSRRLFKLDLALESYEDDTKNVIPLLKETTIELNKFRKLRDQMKPDDQIKTMEILLEKYNKVLDIIGRENFIFYDDGDINYIWGGEKND